MDQAHHWNLIDRQGIVVGDLGSPPKPAACRSIAWSRCRSAGFGSEKTEADAIYVMPADAMRWKLAD